MYNEFEYGVNYLMTPECLWDKYRDKVKDVANEDVADYRLNNNKTTTSKYFEYKTKIIGRAPPTNNKRLNIEFLFHKNI